MDLTAAHEIMGELRRMNFAAADQPTTLNALRGVQRLRGILDAIEIEAARRLQELTHHAPTELAAATQQTRHTADRVYQRAATLATVPSKTTTAPATTNNAEIPPSTPGPTRTPACSASPADSTP